MESPHVGELRNVCHGAYVTQMKIGTRVKWQKKFLCLWTNHNRSETLNNWTILDVLCRSSLHSGKLLLPQETLYVLLRDWGEELGIMYHLNVPHTLSPNTLVKGKAFSKVMASPLLAEQFSREKKKKKEWKINKGGEFLHASHYLCLLSWTLMRGKI